VPMETSVEEMTPVLFATWTQHYYSQTQEQESDVLVSKQQTTHTGGEGQDPYEPPKRNKIVLIFFMIL